MNSDLQERVFAVILFYAAPPQLAREVQDGSEELVEAEPFGLGTNRLCGGFEQRRVERGREADGGGPDGPVVCESM